LQALGGAVTTALPFYISGSFWEMTNRSAFILGLIIVVAIASDVMLYGSEHVVFLAKKLADLLEWMAFWR
jgi:hypothetical protein